MWLKNIDFGFSSKSKKNPNKNKNWMANPFIFNFVFLVQCCLCFSTASYDKKFVDKLLSNRTGLLDNGASITNGSFTLSQLVHDEDLREKHSVRCIISVENWTSWKLRDALSHNHCGYVHEDYPAVNVDPAMREVILGHKSGGTATGTCGTVSWQIEELDTRLIVMWSVPFNYNIYDSHFAVGMIFNRGRFTSSSYWFNQMYYSERGPYKRGSGGQTIVFQNSAVLLHGYMDASTYHPMLNISVVPAVRYKLAPLVWKRLYNAEKSSFTGGGVDSKSQMVKQLASLFTAGSAKLSFRSADQWCSLLLVFLPSFTAVLNATNFFSSTLWWLKADSRRPPSAKTFS